MTAETEPSPDEMLAAFRAYAARFGQLPPLAAWCGTDAVLVQVLNTAVREGRRLTEGDLARATGVKPVPPGAWI